VPLLEKPPAFSWRSHHASIDQHVERQTAAGAELQDPNASLDAVLEHHAAHTAERAQIAGQARHPGSIEILPADSHCESVRKPGLRVLLNVTTQVDAEVFLELQRQPAVDGQRLTGDERGFV